MVFCRRVYYKTVFKLVMFPIFRSAEARRLPAISYLMKKKDTYSSHRCYYEFTDSALKILFIYPWPLMITFSDGSDLDCLCLFGLFSTGRHSNLKRKHVRSSISFKAFIRMHNLRHKI